MAPHGDEEGARTVVRHLREDYLTEPEAHTQKRLNWSNWCQVLQTLQSRSQSTPWVGASLLRCDATKGTLDKFGTTTDHVLGGDAFWWKALHLLRSMPCKVAIQWKTSRGLLVMADPKSS